MQTPARRYDIYAFIHKGLRAFMADTLLRVGQLDLNDEEETREVIDALLLLLENCQAHLQHENDFVHAAMEARQPDSANQTGADHLEHLQEIARLRAWVSRLSGPEYLQAEILSCLYQDLAKFVGDNYLHMVVEESDNNIVLWQNYSDAEIMALNQRLVASIPPEEAIVMLGWMVRYLNPSERALLLKNIQKTMPAEAFASLLGSLQTQLTPKNWRKLQVALEEEQPEAELIA